MPRYTLLLWTKENHAGRQVPLLRQSMPAGTFYCIASLSQARSRNCLTAPARCSSCTESKGTNAGKLARLFGRGTSSGCVVGDVTQIKSGSKYRIPAFFDKEADGIV